MAAFLSKNEITSFCGNVLPLRLISDRKPEGIRWHVEGNCVEIRTFSKEEEFPFEDGILLTLMKPGEAVVTAEAQGEGYSCKVTVKERKQVTAEEELQYYVGDFHDHTTGEHNHKRFAERTEGFAYEYIRQVKDENRLDFCVISDHACTLNPRDFFRGFTDEEDEQPMEIIIFPGSEAEVTVREYDRYGQIHKNSGEIVAVNADNFVSAHSWEEFQDAYAHSPFAVCALAHPQIVGHSTPGVWNFSLHKNNTPFMKRAVKLVEMGDGSDRMSNIINEYTYSVALDNGFKVSTTCASDSHGPVWGYDRLPGKTVIMAPEKSKEAFLDALLHNRVYACSSGNLKVAYSVNGVKAPATLPLTQTYRFHVKISCFHEDETTNPVKCQVISDYGKTVKVIEGVDFSTFDFEVESDSARYYYLRLIDREGRKTWSVPVWTGRESTLQPEHGLVPLDKTGFSAVDLVTSEEVSVLLNDDPTVNWYSSAQTAEIVIDMQKVQRISGLGHYPAILNRKQIIQENLPYPALVAKFPVDYRIATSIDGVSYTECADGLFRVFGGEEVICFEEHPARYVKLELLTTAGRASELKEYADATLTLAELTVYGRA